MEKIYKMVLACCLLLTALPSCSISSNKASADLEKQFATAIPISDMNKSLQVSLSQEGESFQSGSRIELIIRNKSPYSLYFDKTSHVRLMGSVDNYQWVEVKNAIKYANDLLLSPYGTVLLDSRYTVVRPTIEQIDLESRDDDLLLRITVVAEIMDGETHTGQNVAAYVDVNLKP